MTRINDFEEIIKLAQSEITEPYKMNFNLNVEFGIDLLNNPIKDAIKLATDFQNPKCPKNLYMNHGEYIHRNKDGIENIISELKAKHASNRAIISLINQCDIVNSGDKPIPSFMILQFSLEDRTLYVTLYFKALEVSKFLRINIEETRMILKKIDDSLVGKIENINLTIFAFRAYIKEDINVLERPELDQKTSQEIFKLLKEDPNVSLIPLIEAKKHSSTKIEYQSFQFIRDWIEDEDADIKNFIHDKLKRPMILEYIKKIIEIMQHIEGLRCKISHGTEVNEVEKLYREEMEKLIREIRNDS
ncbi:MAG: hypothetical protein EOL97_13315 [Spirochaetia bacterium]|nr:hypothetical protein [Spirochaetia bacterium]